MDDVLAHHRPEEAQQQQPGTLSHPSPHRTAAHHEHDDAHISRNRVAMAMSVLDSDYIFKIVLVGDAYAGKSSLLQQFCSPGQLSEAYKATVGVDFNSRTMKHNGQRCKYQLWDTAGQERFRSLASAYYRGAQGIMIVYDVTEERSFLNVDYWMNEIELHAGTPSVCVAIVGNKSDLRAARSVTFGRGREKAQSFETPARKVLFFETSAKTNHNVEDAFVALGTDIMESGPQESSALNASNSLVATEDDSVCFGLPKKCT